MGDNVMPKFSDASLTILATVHPDIQRVFNEVIKRWDCKALSGRRTVMEQAKLYSQGRDGRPGPIVTNDDGVRHPSPHQRTVVVDGKEYGCALDITPYPVNWNDREALYAFAGYVLGVGDALGVKLRCGADWDGDRDFHDQTLYDIDHFELVLP